MTEKRKLPIGIQSFSKLRAENCYYVDKTRLAWQLVQAGGYYFLSRPRRFGKSLLLDTLKELFEANEALFRDLYIHDHWDWQQRYPVIRISFGMGAQDRTDLNHKIQELLLEHQHRLGIRCEYPSLSGQFKELIRKAHEKYGQPVVVLVDEYDKPILDNVTEPGTAISIREGLKSLYSVIKESDEHVHFCLLTGVTKFSKVGLFSGLNNLNDITLDAEYSALCGYTEADLDQVFAPELAELDRAQIRAWYNGYNWQGVSVYNPFDILLLFEKRQFRAFWFETGSPSFLLKLFKQKQYFLPDLEAIEVSEEILDSFDVEWIDPVTLLFQAGYLTLDQSYTALGGQLVFRLRLPNQEVRQSLSGQLATAYVQQTGSERYKIQQRLYDALEQGDLTQLERQIISLFAAIPWRNFTQNGLPDNEGYYASVLYAFFASLNAQIIPEDISNKGQVDMTVMLGDFIYVLEIKRDERADYQAQQPNPALAQIRRQGYAQKYLASGKTVIELGMVFSTQVRNLVQMDWNLFS